VSGWGSRFAFAAVALAGWACGSQDWSFDTNGDAASRDAGAESAAGRCQEDDDCSADASVCNVSRGVCIRCTSDSDCANASGGRVCQAASGRCVDCVKDTDCPSAHPRCNTATDRCVRCLSNADCGFESFCVGETCTTMF
jgi:hypothetical protein